MRDETDEPVPWHVIAERFGVAPGTIQYIYNKAKDEQKEKKE